MIQRPRKRKRPGRDSGAVIRQLCEPVLKVQESGDIRNSPLYTIPPQERHGLQIFALNDGSVALTQTIDRETRTIALCADEAEILADRRCPTRFCGADKLKRGRHMSNLYVKVFTGFYTHRKTLRLRATLGDDAFWVPPRLWAYAVDNQPDGVFENYSPARSRPSLDIRVMLQVCFKHCLKQGSWMNHRCGFTIGRNTIGITPPTQIGQKRAAAALLVKAIHFRTFP